MNASEIINYLEQRKYNYYGLRSMTRNPIDYTSMVATVGEILDNSYAWDDGETTDYQLTGTSALEIDIDDNEERINQVIADIAVYHSGQVVLLGSYSRDYGSDEGEVILRNAEVLLTWDI